ncbi:phosphoribosyl-AMP cyclohydrolase [Sphingorhabdus sp.]|jgi:phosphoribosyl-AMP cyclohydrolase|uniref:phosphoribosyl-AMP cyclohydrolase n=1 Tax=Sphingorhabdus sp. TaxID=1902408 RepID=UPI0037CBAC34
MTDERESGSTLNPKYDANGLVTAVITDATDGTVLMVGHMNAEALAKSLETRTAVFFSRSRQRLWQKGESSGHVLHIVDMRIDCDQDALWIIARPQGPTCHTGAQSCFYRKVTDGGLEPV